MKKEVFAFQNHSSNLLAESLYYLNTGLVSIILLPGLEDTYISFIYTNILFTLKLKVIERNLNLNLFFELKLFHEHAGSDLNNFQ